MKAVAPKLHLLASLVLAVAARTAHAYCGPYFAEYRVVTSGAGNYGVRCVAKTPDGLVWYGEGAWNGQTYRHVGRVDGPEPGSLENGWMRDIFGNGESFRGSFDGIRLSLSESQVNGIPTLIRMVGPQREAWRLVDATTPPYVSALPPIRTCGTLLRTYRVNVAGDGNYGVRCVMESSHSAPTLFLGEGTWNRQRYLHLGYTNSSPNRGSAGDICRAGTDFCGSTGQDALIFNTRAPGRLQVRGVWNEDWSLVE